MKVISITDKRSISFSTAVVRVDYPHPSRDGSNKYATCHDVIAGRETSSGGSN